MTLTDIMNHKQRNIALWLNDAMSSDNLLYEIFLEHNPNYPNEISRTIEVI